MHLASGCIFLLLNVILSNRTFECSILVSYYNASHKTISSDTTYRSTSFWTDLLPYKTTFFGLQPFTQKVEYQLEMKISVLLAATVTAKKNASWQQKEWEVQDAYFAGKEVVLSDPSVRSNKQWHDCGDKPPVPVDGRDVKCYGAYCAAVCPIGWRSRGRWRIKCQADNTWSHSKFSPCITCPDMSGELDNTNAVSQTTFRKNLPVTQFFCPYATHQLKIGDQVDGSRQAKCQMPMQKWSKRRSSMEKIMRLGVQRSTIFNF